MAIGTYAQLQTALAAYLDETMDLAADFITLAESRINRDLGMLRTAWVDDTLSGTPGSRLIALPSDFVEAQALFLTTSGENVKYCPMRSVS